MWADMVHNNWVQCNMEHGPKDPDHDPDYVPYRLHNEWLDAEECQECQHQEETTAQCEAIRCWNTRQEDPDDDEYKTVAVHQHQQRCREPDPIADTDDMTAEVQSPRMPRMQVRGTTLTSRRVTPTTTPDVWQSQWEKWPVKLLMQENKAGADYSNKITGGYLSMLHEPLPKNKSW